MTLRLRMVIALVGLVTVGLAVFGITTYGLYSRSQYDRLDDEIRASAPEVTRYLVTQAGGGVGDLDDAGLPGPGRGEPQPHLPIGTYGELVQSDGTVLAATPVTTGSDTPDLPDDVALPSGTPEGVAGERLFNTGSVDGSTRWRVLVTADPRFGDRTIVVAVPMNDVRASLDRLVLIEASAAVALLALLGAGSWLVLRRGLRPLERMASVAGTITAGGVAADDLAARVAPADGRSESASSAWPSTRCSTTSRPRSGRGRPARRGYASSWPTRRTSCGRR